MSEVNPKNRITMALEVLYGIGFEVLDKSKPSPVDHEGYLDALKEGYEAFNKKQIEDAYQQAKAGYDAEEEYRAARAAMKEDWVKLPAFIRWVYNDIFEAAILALNENDNDGAKMLIDLAEPKAGFTEEQLAFFNGVKASFKSKIDALNK